MHQCGYAIECTKVVMLDKLAASIAFVCMYGKATSLSIFEPCK